MSPTIEEPVHREYSVRFNDGQFIEFHAETVREPTEKSPHFVFKVGDTVVAKYKKSAVDGWFVKE